MSVIYQKLGKFYDMGTAEGRREIMGGGTCKPIFCYDEAGELVNFYNRAEDREKNAQLIKSVKEKYPGRPLLKALELFEGELMLKAQPKSAPLLVKSTKPKTNFEKLLQKLDEMGQPGKRRIA